VVEKPVVSARDTVLGSIRQALSDAPAAPAVPRAYRPAAAATADAVALFCERASGYRADVVRVAPGELGEAIAAACARRGSRRVVLAPGLAVDIPRVESIRDDPPLGIAALDSTDAAVTGCALAIAETGTIVLDGGAASGRRVLTLVPDHHVCVVEEAAIVNGVVEAVETMAAAARARRPLTLVSGPSATSDIELERVEGVHGPRLLDVVVVVGRRARRRPAVV